MDYDAYEDHSERWFEVHNTYDGFDDAYANFIEGIHDPDVDHSADSDLAHYLEEIGLRDEDWPWDVGDTP